MPARGYFATNAAHLPVFKAMGAPNAPPTKQTQRRINGKNYAFFLPCLATASIAAFTFSGSPR